MAFHNNPGMKNAEGERVNRQYTHQSLVGDHHGIHWAIQTNGDVIITSSTSSDNEEYDEIRVPNLFIFQISQALRMTRSIEVVETKSDRPWKDKQYTHQPLNIEHLGMTAKIQENGRIIIRSAEIEYDEIEVPASLIFKLAQALKMTRTVEMVPVVGNKP
jgi:hypothetical protein